MFGTFKLAMNISFSSNINWFLYYIKRIPFLGKLFKGLGYFNLQTKKNMTTLFIVLSVLAGLFKKTVNALLVLILPILIMTSKEGYHLSSTFGADSFYHLYFFLYLLFSGIMNCYTLEPKRMKFICVKLMRMDAREYTVSTYFIKKVLDTLTFLPIIIGLSLLFGGTVLEGIILAITSQFAGFMGESVFLFYYSRKRKFLHKNNYFMFGNFILFLLAAYVPVFLRQPLHLTFILLHPGFLAVILILGILAARFIFKYPLYEAGINESNRLEDIQALNVKQVSKESRFADVKLKEDQYDREELRTGKYNNLSGFEYLNSIFFSRHKKQIIKPVEFYAKIIGVLLIAGIAATYKLAGFAEGFSSVIFKKSTILVFIMYMLSNTVQKATRAMFYNCDISLLHYGFYKNKKSLLKMFWLRLNYLTGLNLLPAVLLDITLFVLTYLNRPEKLASLIPILIFVLLLSMFFTVHNLFLYYILQPFTTELNMKSPVYNIMNTITYMACWFCLQIETAPSNFVLIVMAATVVYIAAALLLVSKYAPKTFTVK